MNNGHPKRSGADSWLREVDGGEDEEAGRLTMGLLVLVHLGIKVYDLTPFGTSPFLLEIISSHFLGLINRHTN